MDNLLDWFVRQVRAVYDTVGTEGMLLLTIGFLASTMIDKVRKNLLLIVLVVGGLVVAVYYLNWSLPEVTDLINNTGT